MSQMVLAGVDVSATSLDAALRIPGKAVERQRTFDNTPEGLSQFLRWLLEKKPAAGARVCFESTGVYSLELAMLLHRSESVEVMVVNPRSMSSFRDAAMLRNKTDRDDARLSLEYLERMEFKAWKAPRAECWELRQVARRISELVRLRTQEKNRLHAAQAAQNRAWLIQDLELHLEQLETHIERLRALANQLIQSDEMLLRRYQQLFSVVGIGRISAIQILGELAVLPEGMKVKQWVAWAGLDPVQYQSGTSVHRPPRISRRGNSQLRQALFMPALSAARNEPHFKAFSDQLLRRGKKPLQVKVAVMRKLLHVIFGMFKHDTEFVASKVRALRPEEHALDLNPPFSP